jgi:hypothetical protein
MAPEVNLGYDVPAQLFGSIPALKSLTIADACLFRARLRGSPPRLIPSVHFTHDIGWNTSNLPPATKAQKIRVV